MQSLLGPMKGLPGAKSIDTEEDTLAVEQISCQRVTIWVPAAWHPLGTKQTGKGCEHRIQVPIHAQATCAEDTDLHTRVQVTP